MPNEGNAANAANAVNTANAASLKRQRATIKACCTRTQTYVESIGAINSSVKAQLEERKAKLEHYWTEYNGIQSELEFLDANEVSDRDGFEKAYYALAAKIRELLNPPVSPTRMSASPSPSTSTFPNASDSSFHVRLPKLNLPKFSGKHDEWFPFHDAFNSIIHANPSINNIQRLQYLRGCLSGEASDVVSSLEISELNYEVAWRLLRERYDNKKVIVHTHIRAIVELPAMTKENGFELRQIADGATKHINALQALKRPTAHWDDILIYILSTKLDPITLREWQISLTGTELPTMKQLLEFITHKYQVLEATGKSAINTRSKSNAKQQSACHATLKYKCSYCNGDHSVFRCKDFLALSISRRKSEIRSRGLCINCLRSTAHQANQCTAGSCKSCKGKHNTLLHVSTESESQDSEKKQNETSGTKAASTVATHTKSSNSGYVMLSTAIVHVTDNKNTLKEACVLLDCGSQANFVSRQFLDTLGLKARSLNISISGVNGAVSQSTHIVSLKLQSRLNSYSICLDCIVADRVTDALPGVDLKRSTFDLPRNINLADPQFHRSSKVDILVGAEAFWDLLCVGQIKSSSRHPTLQKTRLGWILAGRLGKPSNSTQCTHAFHASVTNMQLHEELARFWHQEEVSNRANYTMEEAYCEQHFIENVTQAEGGKLIVKLPVKEQLINRIGSSREIALKRFLNLEKRFKRDPLLKLQYSRFMEEYLSLGHMQKVNVTAQDDSVLFYFPHHCVYKHAERSKLRVVFDASCKSSTGISLNDALCTGPVVQQDLMSILMRFRTFAYVLVADVVKMYRQILIHPSQTSLQRILWRNDTESEIGTFELITVTYGTSSASFLATRCLNYLANLHAEKYPIGSKCIQRDFYVDDLLTGADTFEDSKLVRDEIIKLLELGSFKLSKWASNLPELLKEVGEQFVSPVTISDGAHSRILGIQWDQTADAFLFSYELQEDTSIVSKRIILSNVAKLFDPLGLLGPIVVTAKLILQELWQAGSQWDESVPQNIHSRWLNFKSKLPELNQLQVSRRVKFEVDPQLIQIHEFCDASQRAYGACVRTIMGADEGRTSLLCSKSRVAPLRR